MKNIKVMLLALTMITSQIMVPMLGSGGRGMQKRFKIEEVENVNGRLESTGNEGVFIRSEDDTSGRITGKAYIETSEGRDYYVNVVAVSQATRQDVARGAVLFAVSPNILGYTGGEGLGSKGETRYYGILARRSTHAPDVMPYNPSEYGTSTHPGVGGRIEPIVR